MKNIVLKSVLFCFVLTQNCAHKATVTKEPIYNGINLKDSLLIDSLFVDFSKNRPGASVLLAKGDKIIYQKGFGLIDLENKKPIESSTKFYLASASKQFTAMAILQLIDKGSLNFETKLTDIFPDFPDYGSDITIQYLLTHQSGLPEINHVEGKLMTDNLRLKQLYKTDSLLFASGTKCEYSNTAYSVLAEIVAKISKMPFDSYMQKFVFSPIGMDNTLYYHNSKQQNTGYQIKKDSISKAPGVRDATMGSGSVYTSTSDYFKWHLALNDYSLISKKLQLKSYQAQKGAKNNWGYYGYGWYALENDTFKFVEHGGISQSGGFICFTARIPEENITVAIFTNRAWNKDNIPSQNIGNRIKALLHIATESKFPRPLVIDPVPKKSLAQSFINELMSNNINSAKKLFNKEKDSKTYYIDEKEFNQVGYYLLKQKRITEAIEVLRMNIELFPDSWNAYDSLAEAYMININNKLALKYYRKSIELNPKNTNAKQQINKIRNEQ